MDRVTQGLRPAIDAAPADWTTSLMRVLAWAGIAIGALWLVMSLTYPFGWDQGILAWAGSVITQGGMPYQDAWDMKGPLAFYTYALAEALFGVHLWSIRILDAALLAAATLAVGRSAAALTDRLTGQWAALVYFLWYASHSYWHTAQPDGWAGMLLIVGLAPLISRPESTKLLPVACAGLCIGAMTLLKPLYAAFLLLPFLHIFLMPSSKRVARAAVATSAWLLPIALTAGWFAMRGALDELLAVHIRYAAAYAGLSPGNRLRGLVDYFLTGRVIAVALPVLLFGGFALWRDRRRPAAIMLVTSAAIAVLLVALQNRFYEYQWLPILPLATLLGAVGLQAVVARMRTLGHILCGVILIHCLAPIVLEEARFVSWVSGRMDREAYYAAYGEPGDDMRAVRWLREEGQPGPVFIFGWNTGVAWLSERPTVSRFGFSMPLMMGEGLEVRSEYRAELLEALRATPARYILSGNQSAQIMGRSMTVTDFPELADLIRTDYRQAVQLGRITIYEHAR